MNPHTAEVEVILRPALLKDLPEITEIYNEAVLTTDATMDTQPRSVEEQEAWFSHHDDRYPILVAACEGKIAGWGSLSRWSDRCGYAGTVELSFYVRSEFRGKGIGKKLINTLVETAERLRHHSIISRITAGNEISLHLHEGLSFQNAGMLRECGYKFDRWVDVVILQKLL